MVNGDAPRCPISTEKVDENAARINGALVVAVLIVSLLTPYRWLLAFLVVDFALKVFAGFASSPVCKAARLVAEGAGLPRRMTDSAPKRFAAVMGLLMGTAGLVVAYLVPVSPVAFYAIVGTLLACAALEAFAGFCLGCWIYGLLPEGAARLFVRPARGGV